MNVFCVCVVRDEVDVLRHTLDAALGWARAIYVYDNGSTDGTWELLQEFAGRHQQVILAGRDLGLFGDDLRGKVANKFLAEAQSGDWWCRLDADEIYVDDPRELLSRIAPYYQVVFSESIQYFFTDLDLAAYERDPALYTENWRPERLRHYLTNWSEERFVRHIPGVEWTGAWPAGFWEMWTAPQRVPLRHFQYRSPPQIQHRLQTRLANNDGRIFGHERRALWVPRGLREQDMVWPFPAEAASDLWKTRVVRAAALNVDSGDGRYQSAPSLLPPMWGRRPLAKRMVAYVRSLGHKWVRQASARPDRTRGGGKGVAQ